jgi:predicted secreted Zn-dependent protease
VNAASLADAAAVFAGRDEAGETTWKPIYNVVTKDGVVVSATVTVPVTVLMPKWPGASKLSKAAQAEWKRASAALKRHEQHHVDLAKQYLKDLHKKMIGKTEEEAGAIFTEAVEQLQKASDDYDTATNHGSTEGTDLDTSIP